MESMTISITMNQRSILNIRRLTVIVMIGFLLSLVPHTVHAMARVYENQTTY